ncbi:MAG: hypothetical protein PWQ83_2058 [Thermosipho sp. (in: thermotogales)]|jgi:hypothetical protein|nr:hypothetical protein [Thermosipho sp. (in: thermotogales)]
MKKTKGGKFYNSNRLLHKRILGSQISLRGKTENRIVRSVEQKINLRVSGRVRCIRSNTRKLY